MSSQGEREDAESVRRLTGDAAWRAHCDAIEKRNAVTRKHAAEKRSAIDVAAAGRARRLAAEDDREVQALNRRQDTPAGS